MITLQLKSIVTGPAATMKAIACYHHEVIRMSSWTVGFLTVSIAQFFGFMQRPVFDPSRQLQMFGINAGLRLASMMQDLARRNLITSQPPKQTMNQWSAITVSCPPITTLIVASPEPAAIWLNNDLIL
jgi:hypothetical protein